MEQTFVAAWTVVAVDVRIGGVEAAAWAGFGVGDSGSLWIFV